MSHPVPQIHQIYETMQRWDPVASTLPDVVQRLVTLRDLHEQGEGLEGLLGTVAWCEREHIEWGGTAPPPSPELSPPSQPHSSGRSSCTWTPRSRRRLGLSRTTACCWRRWVPATAGGVEWGPHPAPPAHPLPHCPPQLQKTMKENLAIVEENFAEIDARIKWLQK